MRLSCSTGKHAVAPDAVRNQGLEFSNCLRCGRDMVRSRREWREVPKGFRVTWRRSSPREAEIATTQLLLDLPSSGRALILPADRRAGPGWFGLAIELAMLGMIHLAASAASRLRLWFKAMISPRLPGARILALPPA